MDILKKQINEEDEKIYNKVRNKKCQNYTSKY